MFFMAADEAATLGFESVLLELNLARCAEAPEYHACS